MEKVIKMLGSMNPIVELVGMVGRTYTHNINTKD